MKRHLKEFVKDDPEFARQQLEKLVERGEIERDVAEQLLRMRYGNREENK
jgi:hypothetical protein